MNLREFTLRVQEILERHFPEQEFEFSPDEGLVATEALRFSLGNLLAEYSNETVEDDDLEKRIVLHFGNAFEMIKDQALVFPTWEVAKPRLRLQLANLSIPEFANAITFPFSHEVGSAVVIDAPSGYAYVQKQNAETWGQTAVDLIEIARDNLQEAAENTQAMKLPSPEGDFIVVQESDGYAAARILLPSFRKFLIESLAPSTGFVWVGVPNRDFLIAWPDSLHPDTKKSIQKQIAIDAERQHHPLCSVPLRVTQETIAPQE